jgi:hypothetical protein
MHAKSGSKLSIYGNINEVKVTEGDVSIVFSGIAHLSLNDPSLKEQVQYSCLSHAVIHLKFDNGFKGMHTYSSFRYLDWINEEQARSILNECQKKSVDDSLLGSLPSADGTKDGYETKTKHASPIFFMI